MGEREGQNGNTKISNPNANSDQINAEISWSLNSEINTI